MFFILFDDNSLWNEKFLVTIEQLSIKTLSIFTSIIIENSQNDNRAKISYE